MSCQRCTNDRSVFHEAHIRADVRRGFMAFGVKQAGFITVIDMVTQTVFFSKADAEYSANWYKENNPTEWLATWVQEIVQPTGGQP